MFIALIIVTILLIICLLVLVSDRLEKKSLERQLELVLKEFSTALVKSKSMNYKKNILVDQINELIIKLDTIKSDYRRILMNQKMMISSLAHDFRTPLTSVLGYLQLLKVTSDESKQSYYLSIVENRAKDLAELIEGFYQLSLLDSDEYVLNVEPLNPNCLLQNQIALYYEDLKRVFDSVAITIEEDHLLVSSDQKSLNRIFSNLIKNSLVHGKNSFVIETWHDEHSCYIVFKNQVSENADIDVDRIFARLYQVNHPANSNSSGLGLNIAKELSNRLKHTLTAKIEGNWLSFELILERK